MLLLSLLSACLVLLQPLPLAYRAVRPKLWQQLLSGCALLSPLLPQLPHNALTLLDAAAAAGLVDVPAQEPDTVPPPSAAPRALPQSWMMAACVVVAAQAAATKGWLAAVGASLPSEQEVCGYFGLQLDELIAAAARLREVCGAACCSPTSAYSMVEVYLEALLAGQLDRKVGGGRHMAGHSSRQLLDGKHLLHAAMAGLRAV